MNTYYFYLDLGQQKKSLDGKFFARAIRCNDPYVDGLELFEQHIKSKTKYKFNEEHVFIKKL